MLDGKARVGEAGAEGAWAQTYSWWHSISHVSGTENLRSAIGV